MAEIIWTEPALDQLSDIAEFIALDKPAAAARLVQRVFDAVARLERFPNSGRALSELSATVYREVIVNPSRVIYRKGEGVVYIVHVMRNEQGLRRYLLE
ncbi:MAG: toxin ParE1/3/4 [Bacteroidia bacterium]|jgi:toxin ParE1/3/4